MKIHVVGGGPAGLFFAILMKQHDPSHQVRVWERDPKDNTFGFGVVFSRRTLQVLAEGDPAVADGLRAVSRQWEDVVVGHPDQFVRVGGNHFVGTGRMALLNLLQERAAALGVEITYQEPVEDVAALRDCDLLVGADGRASKVRDAYADTFRPTIQEAHNRYIWLGTPHLFDGLGMTFRPHDGHLFMSHNYRFSEDMSTFIVECDEPTFEAHDFPEEADQETLEFLARVFVKDLEGDPLVSNHSRWIRFTLIQNEQWYHENVVLLGDALHTAHFSVGSGTKLAMEDSLALARSLQAAGDVADGLAEFQALRKPVVDDFQRSALASLTWFETARSKLHLAPLPFAMDLMCRSNRLVRDKIRQRDPFFVDAVEGWEATHAKDQPSG